MAEDKVSRNAQKLLNVMETQTVITTEEAMQLLRVSQATVRRLFRSMAESGVALRTFGGICRVREATSQYLYETVENQNWRAKGAIAEIACGLCTSGDVLYLDGGSTLHAFAKALAARLDAGTLHDISVYTNSLTTLNALSGHCSVSLMGGRWRENRRDFCGYLAEESIRKLTFRICFLGADACESRGFTTTDFETARLNELATSFSCHSYVLADAEKFRKKSFVPYAALSQVTGVITDATLSKKTLAEFTGFGATIMME